MSESKEQLIASLVKKHKVSDLNAVDAMHEMFDLLAPKWVSVEEGLPEKGRTVNILLECENRTWVSSGFIASDNNWYTDVMNGRGVPDGANNIAYKVVKWTNLPTPPKEKP